MRQFISGDYKPDLEVLRQLNGLCSRLPVSAFQSDFIESLSAVRVLLSRW
jgi:hypothetical protein